MNTITIEDVKNKLDNGEDILLLDVREPNEHEDFNIGGRLLPLGNIRIQDLESIEDWQDKDIIVYCRSGNRSAQACMILEQVGFNPTNLAGGMLAWEEKYGH